MVKNLSNNDFKYLCQEFDNNISDQVKEKGFHLHEYLVDFKKFTEQLPSKETFFNFLKGKKISDKKYEMFLMFGKIWNKNYERLTQFVFTSDILLLADFLEKFRNNSLMNYGLRPSHYLSTVGSSWDAMLNM